MTRVGLSIGSNIGDRDGNILKAIDCIERDFNIEMQSSIIETKPYGYPDQPDFLNMALVINTGINPTRLLRMFQSIEEKLGRKKELRWGPRIIDIDILFVGNTVINEKDLVIPHPDMQNRLFVLQPLNEIYPKWIHPLLNKRVDELLTDLLLRINS